MTDSMICAMAAGSPIDLRGVLVALPLAAFVLLCGYLIARQNKTKKQKPGQYLLYTVPGKTAAACRGLLNSTSPQDVFVYTLETAKGGGWYLHLTMHSATQQPLDTLYLLQFENDDPAQFTLSFLREAFGMREPVVGEALMDEFFAAKLGAQRVAAPLT